MGPGPVGFPRARGATRWLRSGRPGSAPSAGPRPGRPRPPHDPDGVASLLDSLRKAGAYEPAAALTERLSAAGMFVLFLPKAERHALSLRRVPRVPADRRPLQSANVQVRPYALSLRQSLGLTWEARSWAVEPAELPIFRRISRSTKVHYSPPEWARRRVGAPRRPQPSPRIRSRC